MNKTYRLVWNAASATWVAASELVAAQGKSKLGVASVLVAAALAAPMAQAAQASTVSVQDGKILMPAIPGDHIRARNILIALATGQPLPGTGITGGPAYAYERPDTLPEVIPPIGTPEEMPTLPEVTPPTGPIGTPEEMPTLPEVTTPPEGGESGVAFKNTDDIVHAAVPDVAANVSNSILGSYHQRLGSQAKASQVAASLWARVFGGDTEIAYHDASFNQSTDSSTAGFQLGKNFAQHTTSKGHLASTGAYVAYAKTDATVSVSDANTDFGFLAKTGELGSLSIDTYALGLTHTINMTSGTYVDLVGQFSYYESTSADQASLSTDGTGVHVSVEMGKALYNGGLVIEPQGQLILFSDSFNEADDANGNHIELGKSKGVQARAGLRFTKADETAAFQPSLTTNIWTQSATGSDFSDSGSGFNADDMNQNATWGEVDLGGSFKINNQVSVYGHVTQSISLDSNENAKHDGTQASIGLNVAF
jgi:autotransporter family porin